MPRWQRPGNIRRWLRHGHTAQRSTTRRSPAAAIALTGFHSAITRSHAGIPEVVPSPASDLTADQISDRLLDRVLDRLVRAASE
jgi:hypothetical protein